MIAVFDAGCVWAVQLSDPTAPHSTAEFRLEEDAFFDGTRVTYLDGRQSEFHLIGGR